METLSGILPIIIYILLIILLVIGIILGIKLIITIDKVNDIVEDVEEKIESLNGIFKVCSMASDKIGTLSTKVVSWATSLVQKIISKRKEEEEDYE